MNELLYLLKGNARMEANEVRYLLMRKKSERGEPSHDLFRRQKR